jgi:hypothetical protein
MSAATAALSAAGSPPDFRQDLDALLSLTLDVLRDSRQDVAPNYESGGQDPAKAARQARPTPDSPCRSGPLVSE